MIVTVTLNAAVDRTLTVPNFQTGHRHRASASLTSAGGKGINVARALKRLDSPVIATGLAGGRTGDRIIDELATEAILNDFVRISDESRTSTALVDPTAGMLSEIYEWGPAVRPEELETLLDKLHYLSRVASYVVFSGSLPRDVADDFYAEAIRDLNRRGVQCVLDTEGEPLRVGVEAEPFLVSPNQREAESLVGQEFSEDEDFLVALDAIADLGARNVLITQETSCFGLFREERTVRRFRASIPRVEPIAPVGAGDVLLARSTRPCARRSVAPPHPSSSSARAGSIPVRPCVSRPAWSSKSSSRSRLRRRGARECAHRASGSRPRRAGRPRGTGRRGALLP
jgi:1-phosphofructokinase family hexose kinase